MRDQTEMALESVRTALGRAKAQCWAFSSFPDRGDSEIWLKRAKLISRLLNDEIMRVEETD